jgi:hypothetical protein
VKLIIEIHTILEQKIAIELKYNSPEIIKGVDYVVNLLKKIITAKETI